MNEYLSIAKEASAELIEKKSRFICSVKPVKTEKEALEFINRISALHKDANHNVFAYVVMEKIEVVKASDDGEPQGTAGMPVLEVIKREGLKNVCVVVTRYFGGILLGAGGLIRAYSASAKQGIDESGICTMCLYKRLSIKTDYTFLGKLQNIITDIGNNITNIEYTELVVIYANVRYDRVEHTVNSILEYTNGMSEIKQVEEFYGIDEKV